MPDDKRVFISYRRIAASFIARSVFQDLRQHDYDVFMDVESIDNGTFDTLILRQIEARPHFVVILTPGTLERCVDPNDWMRREMESAIDKGRNIVPLLVNDFDFSVAKPFLTGKLEELPRYAGLTVPHDYFDAAMDRLRNRFLKQPAIGAIKPAPAADQSVVERTVQQIESQPVPTQNDLSAEIWFRRGLGRDKGDYERKIADYSEAIRLNPLYPDAYKNRAGARYNKGDFDGALVDYHEALRLRPYAAEVYYGRGAAYKAKGDLYEAIRDFTLAIRLKPHYPDAYNSRGMAFSDKGDFDSATADYDQAIRQNPSHADAYKNRAQVSEACGDFDEAIADYQTYLLLDGGRRYRTVAKVKQRIHNLQKRRAQPPRL